MKAKLSIFFKLLLFTFLISLNRTFAKTSPIDFNIRFKNHQNRRRRITRILRNANSYPRKNQQSETPNSETQDQNFVQIINQTPNFYIDKGENDSNYQNADISLSRFNRRKKTKSKICSPKDSILTVNDIPGIVVLVEGIGILYDSYYKNFPDLEKARKAINFNNLLESAGTILSFYKDVRTFVILVVEKKDLIISSLKLLENKAINFKSGEEDMLIFYNLMGKYESIKLKSMPFEDDDPRFAYHQRVIKQITESFQINAQVLFQMISEMLNYANVFLEVIESLSQLGFSKSNFELISIASAVDKVLFSLSTLADIKLELTQTIPSTKEALKNMEIFRETISEALNNISNLADEHKKAMTLGKVSYWRSNSIIRVGAFLIGLFLFVQLN